MKQAAVNIAKNPIILSILLGLVVGIIGIDFPTIVDKTVNSVAQMATPLALITIGAGFEMSGITTDSEAKLYREELRAQQDRLEKTIEGRILGGKQLSLEMA